MLRVLALLTALAPPALADDPVDLGVRYPSTLAATEPATPLAWSSGPEHVWRVDAFRFVDGERFELATGPALVTVGVHGDGPVWATVVPDEAARLGGELVGAGEHVESVYLRFHPADLGALFPGGARPAADDAWRFRDGVRIALRKQANSWAVGGAPMVPPAATFVLDCATVEGPRRFYMRLGDGALEHLPAFDGLVRAPDAPLAPGAGEAAFDEWWAAFDRAYAMFELRDVDWSAVRARFRPLAAECETGWELGCVLSAAAAPLEDRHAWVKVADEFVPHELPALWPAANFSAVMAALGPMTQPRRGINWGRTADGIGYMSVSALDADDLVELFDRGLGDLRDVRGLILDLRFNSGGDERLAQALAGRFAAKSVAYAHHRFRSGPGLTELGPWNERVLEPRAPRFEAPLVVLVGPGVMSSAEAFALMLDACPDATLVGLPTAGSSGNPMLLELAGGVSAAVPRWLAADAERRPFEGRGLRPDVVVDAGPEDFANGDPIFEAALARLGP